MSAAPLSTDMQHKSRDYGRDYGPCRENKVTAKSSAKSMQRQMSNQRHKQPSQDWCFHCAHDVIEMRSTLGHMLSTLGHIFLCVPLPRGELTASPRAAPEAGAHMVCCIEQRITGRGTPHPGPQSYARRCGWPGVTRKRLRRRGSEVIVSLGPWVELYLRVGEAQNPGPDKMAPLQTEIVKDDGSTEHIWLMCAHVKSRGMWAMANYD